MFKEFIFYFLVLLGLPLELLLTALGIPLFAFKSDSPPYEALTRTFRSGVATFVIILITFWAYFIFGG